MHSKQWKPENNSKYDGIDFLHRTPCSLIARTHALRNPKASYPFVALSHCFISISSSSFTLINSRLSRIAGPPAS